MTQKSEILIQKQIFATYVPARGNKHASHTHFTNLQERSLHRETYGVAMINEKLFTSDTLLVLQSHNELHMTNHDGITFCTYVNF